jgi:hypothetical protein
VLVLGEQVSKAGFRLGGGAMVTSAEGTPIHSFRMVDGVSSCGGEKCSVMKRARVIHKNMCEKDLKKAIHGHALTKSSPATM